MTQPTERDAPPPFLGVQPRRGQVVRRRVRIGALVDGSPITIPVVAIRGLEDGPTVYLQSGVHGDEATGIVVAMEVLRGLKPNDIRGTLVAVPTANPAAFLTRSRGFELEERGPIDLNRTYPGIRGGLISERIGDVLFVSFIVRADITIDMHSALAGCTIAAFSYVDPDDDQHGTHEQREQLAMAFNADFVYRKKRGSKLGTSDMSRSLAARADDLGKVAVTLELGQGERVSWELVAEGAEGLRDVLGVAGVLRRERPPSRPKIEFSTIHTVHSEHAGQFRPRVQLGQEVQAGAILGDVADVLTQRRRTVAAPAAGHVLRLMLRPFVMTGAEIAWVVA